MIALNIDPITAKKNIKFLNRIKSELRPFFCSTESLSFLNALENVVFSKNLSKKIIKLKLGIDLTDTQYRKIFTPHLDEIYPNNEQAESFVQEINQGVDLTPEEITALKNKFIHVWQIPRTTDYPQFSSLINLITLFKDSALEESLLLKLNSIVEKKAA